MKFTTIWSIPAMSLGERLRRTEEAFWRWLAHRLPRKLAYWSYIDTGVRHMGDDVVPEVTYTEILKRAGRVSDRWAASDAQ
ncbi:hypothetical protein SEA_LEROY_75 [Gordonia phage Leroy]|nr:hypothetical protein SEA_LEROY_75 [Gordonia phage Leroy]